MKDERIKEIVYQAVQATKSENSGLVNDMRANVAVLSSHFEENGIIDLLRKDVGEIKTQTTKTNGRVSRLEKAMYIVGTVAGTLLVTSGSQLVGFLKSII